jgi:hypothetical protein
MRTKATPFGCGSFTIVKFLVVFLLIFPLLWVTEYNHLPSQPIRFMIITTKDGQSFDTETDLTAPERHILQKLFLWESMASSLEEFRSKKEIALVKGWNNSGPIRESRTLKQIIGDLEEKVTNRLNS